jgi:hypothetical protein
MKRKLYLVGVVFISLLAFSCSTDDLEDSNSGGKIVRTSDKGFINESNEKIIDSSTVVKPSDAEIDSDGEPSNPKPPRK